MSLVRSRSILDCARDDKTGPAGCRRYLCVRLNSTFAAALTFLSIYEQSVAAMREFLFDHPAVGVVVLGLLVGIIAKLLVPGKDPGGIIVTTLLGIAGAFVGTWLGRLFFGAHYYAGWIMSIVGAMVLLLLYRVIFGRRGRETDRSD